MVVTCMCSLLDRFLCQVSKLYSATDHLTQESSDSRSNNHAVPVNHLKQVKTSARPCIYFHRSYPFNKSTTTAISAVFTILHHSNYIKMLKAQVKPRPAGRRVAPLQKFELSYIH